MLVTVTTTVVPATDLGYLLVKHPDRVHSFSVPSGTAYVTYPEAGPERCTAALLLDIDAGLLASARRGRGGKGHGGNGRGRASVPDTFALGQYVNDRPYAASSLLSAAMARVFRSALRGESRDRPELAATAIPLEISVPALRCRGGADLAERLFAPLGWQVSAVPVPLDERFPEWGDSRYVALSLAGTLRLADALNHLYVLLPVLDDAKHYWVAPDEIDKLIRAGEGWLADHPERGLISRRYLAHRRALADAALARLAEAPPAGARLTGARLAEARLAEARLADDAEPDSIDAPDEAVTATDEEAQLPESARRQPLAALRRAAVLAVLRDAGAARVLDLGCGGGALLADLVGDRRFTKIVGTDVSSRALEIAARRLRWDRLPQRQQDRITLWQSALTYTDERLTGYDAAVLMEVIEHVDPPRLTALEAAVFGHARPGTVIVTTPNVEYNVRYESLPAGGFRHSDHRFEWTRAEFTAWSAGVAARHGYAVTVGGIGDEDPVVGAPSQLAVFTRPEPAGTGDAQDGTDRGSAL